MTTSVISTICFQRLTHLGYVKKHGFHDNLCAILKNVNNFSTFFLISKVFTRINEHAILIILISEHWLKALCLGIKLVPNLVVHDCKQLSYR